MVEYQQHSQMEEYQQKNFIKELFKVTKNIDKPENEENKGERMKTFREYLAEAKIEKEVNEKTYNDLSKEDKEFLDTIDDIHRMMKQLTIKAKVTNKDLIKLVEELRKDFKIFDDKVDKILNYEYESK